MTTTTTGPNPAEQIAFNEDLLTEILLNLPTKSLIRFKVVSKQWMSFISGDRFCLSHTRALHTRGSLKPSALFLDVYHFLPSELRFLPLRRDCVRLPRLDFIDVPNLTILQSCNGLLLCASELFFLKSRWRYFICNPTTRKFKMLCLPSPQVEDHLRLGVNLAFDPLKSPHYEIIYVWHQQIKLSSSSQIPENFQFFIDIYSSQNNSWSLSKIKFTWNWGIKYDRGVFFNGAIYWDSILRESQYFDVETECLKTMPMPRVGNKEGCRYFGESGGHLTLAIAHINLAALKFSVFEMLEDHSDWYLKYSLNLEAEKDNLSGLPFCTDYVFLEAYQLFCAIQSEEEGDSIFAVFQDGSAMSYNFKDCTIKALHCPSVGEYRSGYLWCRAWQYFETLTPIISSIFISDYL